MLIQTEVVFTSAEVKIAVTPVMLKKLQMSIFYQWEKMHNFFFIRSIMMWLQVIKKKVSLLFLTLGSIRVRSNPAVCLAALINGAKHLLLNRKSHWASSAAEVVQCFSFLVIAFIKKNQHIEMCSSPLVSF